MTSYYINKFNLYNPPVFSEYQSKILSKYFTNLDKPVYAFTSEMPAEVAGALISRFSRTNKSPRELFWDEFLQNPDLSLDQSIIENKQGQEVAIQRAGKFFQQVLAKYGDESVAEITGVHVVIEKASTITIKVIESMRRMAFIEQSTRYINLTDKFQGQYDYYRDTKLRNILGKEYEDYADTLYDTYTNWFEKIYEYVKSNNPILETDTETGYKQAVHSRTCDILRELLPIGLRATVGVYGFGRDWGDLINIMLSHELEETREVGKMILENVSKIIPNIMERTSGSHGLENQKYLSSRNTTITNIIDKSIFKTKKNIFDNKSLDIFEARILEITDYPLEKLCAGITYNELNYELSSLIEYYKNNPAICNELINNLNDLRKSRFNKVPDGFETVRIKVEFTAPLSCWKDIQRHRKLNQLSNCFFINKGFYISHELSELGIDREYKNVLNKTLEYILNVKTKFPQISKEIEYLVPHASTFRWVMDMDFAEAIYMIELRTGAGGHMAYRKLMHEFYFEIQKKNSDLAKLIKFVDLNNYYLGRRSSYNKVISKGASLE